MKDLAAERAVLAGIFTYGPEAYDDVCDLASSSTFTEPVGQALFRCMEHVLRDPEARVDFPSILSAASSLGLADFLSGEEPRRYLRAVGNFPVRRESVRRLAAKIRKLEIARLFDAQMDQARQRLSGVTGDESIDQIRAIAEEPLFDLSSLLTEQGQGPRLMGEGAEAYVQHLMDNPRRMMGIPTGFARFDRAIGGGLRPNSLDVVAARPKTGKSQLADEFSVNVASAGFPVLNVDTEMDWEEHVHRIIAKLSGVPVCDVETGAVGAAEIPRARALEAARKLRDLPYHYDCVIGRAFEDVLASMRRWVTRVVGLDPDTGKAKPCAIIYDYLKLMSAESLSGDLKEYQALGFVTTALKNFAGRYGAPILCFAQLNRDGIDREETDTISGSDRIIHYCTSFSIYKWKSAEERIVSPGYTHKLIPKISRRGEGLPPGDYVNVAADYRVSRVSEGPTAYELERSPCGMTAKGPQRAIG